MPARVRVKDSVVVRAPGGGGMVPLKADTPYDEDDPLVVEYPWAFDFGENTPAAHGRRGRSRGGVEQATAAPGELRQL
jgi:hypothetical protein